MIQTIRRVLRRNDRKCKRVSIVLPASEANAEEVELPRVVLELLNKAIIHRRSCGPDVPTRILVKLPGSSSFYYSADTVPNKLAEMFPELGPPELEEATSLLRFIVRAEVRAAQRLERGPNWATNW